MSEYSAVCEHLHKGTVVTCHTKHTTRKGLAQDHIQQGTVTLCYMCQLLKVLVMTIDALGHF